jgi:DNA (cytosine-5)-methyltransferase 1
MFTLSELFCGPGGLALGAFGSTASDKLGNIYHFTHLQSNDYDSDTCETYINNICPKDPSSVICTPVQQLDLATLSPFDGLAFGFPCNDFSIVGKQSGLKGNFGTLYTYGVSAINIHNPMFFVAENVSGISTANDGNAFKLILSALEKAGKGYDLTVNLYKFEDYGVPQTRHRYIIVGFRKDLKVKYTIPLPTHINNHVSVSTVLDLNPIPKGTSNNELTVHPPLVIERLKHIPPGENVWHPNLPARLQLQVKGAKLSQIYKRLHPDKPAYTITGSGGGGTHVYHHREPRALTNRERARLQTFPDSFEFYGTKESVRKQIGMAVPPLAAQIIFESVLKALINGL